jgi:hypothetical protein
MVAEKEAAIKDRATFVVEINDEEPTSSPDAAG